MDGLIWSELGATLPGSGGSYLYLLECYGRERWGRLMAFLFIWQFLISGPLEIASGLIAMATFSHVSSAPPSRNSTTTAHVDDRCCGRSRSWPSSFGPSRPDRPGARRLILVLLYRRITSLGRLTVTFWLGVLAVIAWILIEGALHFDPATAFDFSRRGAAPSAGATSRAASARR